MVLVDSEANVQFRLDPPADGVVNMRSDEELLADAENGKAGCRVYSWTAPWITLGRYQKPETDLIDLHKIPWIIRPTGGKAVLHGHDLTVGFAMPLSLLSESERSIKKVYRRMARPMIDAMRVCGLPASLGDDTRFVARGPRVADCFAYVSGNDIVDERTGQKVCGCALKVSQRAALVQASIPISKPLVDPALVIIGGKAIVNAKWDYERFAQELQTAISVLTF